MFKKGKEKTIRTVTSMITRLQKKEQVLVGAHYDSKALAQSIPIATRVEDFTVIGDTMKGTIYFRPVGDTAIETLATFRKLGEYYGLGDFLDEDTEVPLVASPFESNLIGAGSIISNVQEIPFRFTLVEPKVYSQQVTIGGVQCTQLTLENQLELPAPVGAEKGTFTAHQILTLLFMPKEYDAQQLLGYWADRELTKAEGLKIIQFLANGSLSPLLIGAVTVTNDIVVSTMYPLFKDFTLAINETQAKSKGLYIQCDTAVIFTYVSAIKKIELVNTGEYKYSLLIETKQGTINLLLG